MPKIIKNIREQLLAETKAQVENQGYSSTTIRSVANACGIAVGTVYNYFPSKDLMIASYMEEDWKQSLAKMKARCGESAEVFLRRVYNGLKRFMRQHKSLFSDREAKQSYAAAFPLYHGRLRRQIAALILPLCHEKEERDRKYLAAFVAESVITWAQAGTPFDTLYGVLLIVSFICTLGMGYLSTRDFTQAYMNWAAQLVNIILTVGSASVTSALMMYFDSSTEMIC